VGVGDDVVLERLRELLAATDDADEHATLRDAVAAIERLRGIAASSDSEAQREAVAMCDRVLAMEPIVARVRAFEAEKGVPFEGFIRLQSERFGGVLAERDAARAEVSRLKGVVESRVDQIVALEELIEGPGRPPTDAEVDAHLATGGAWVLVEWDIGGMDATFHRNAENLRAWLRRRGPAPHAIAIDSNGRPCAWAKGAP